MGTLVKEYRVFPTGATFRPTETINNVADGTGVAIADNGPYYEAPPAGSEFDYCTYGLVFWTVNGAAHTGPSVNVTVSGTTTVTGWYTHACHPGGGGTAIQTYAFSAAGNEVLTGVTPLAAVTPSALWTPGSTSVSVSEAGSVVLDAKAAIGGEGFDRWLAFGAGSIAADKVTIPELGGGFYVAFFKKAVSGVVPGLLDHLKDVWPELERIPDKFIDPVTDPSPVDLVRLGAILRELRAREAADPAKLSSAEARRALTQVRAELKRLEGVEKDLQSRVGKKGK